ncbi:TRAP transporter small permease [Rheinheimera sp.]|uniref:TRAP transporter small permease n=1 Tax=Rheinheimera sp. TaxID=1869214 RepID=UPI00307D259B
MTKSLFWIDQFLRRVLIGLMAAIVLVVCWQVVSRFILGSPSSMTEEIARTLLLWIGMLGAAWAYRTGQHLGLDILTSKLPATAQHKMAMLLTSCVVLFAVAVLVIGGGALVRLAFELNQMSAALGIGMGWIYLVLPLTGLLIALYGYCQLLCLWRGKPLNCAESE